MSSSVQFAIRTYVEIKVRNALLSSHVESSKEKVNHMVGILNSGGWMNRVCHCTQVHTGAVGLYNSHSVAVKNTGEQNRPNLESLPK